MLAYLLHLAPRLVEMRCLLKDTGSIYLHCDLTASHDVKILMHSILGRIMLEMRLSGTIQEGGEVSVTFLGSTISSTRYYLLVYSIRGVSC